MKKGMVFMLVAVMIFSSSLLPFSYSHPPLSPSNSPDPWTANNTVTMAKSFYNAYVADEGSNVVSVIGLSNNTVWETISVGSEPQGIVTSSSNVYVTNHGSKSVSVIGLSNNTVWKTISVGTQPFGVAISSSNVYVTNQGSNNV